MSKCPDCQYNIFNLYRNNLINETTLNQIIAGSKNANKYEYFKNLAPPAGLKYAFNVLLPNSEPCLRKSYTLKPSVNL